MATPRRLSNPRPERAAILGPAGPRRVRRGLPRERLDATPVRHTTGDDRRHGAFRAHDDAATRTSIASGAPRRGFRTSPGSRPRPELTITDPWLKIFTAGYVLVGIGILVEIARRLGMGFITARAEVEAEKRKAEAASGS